MDVEVPDDDQLGLTGLRVDALAGMISTAASSAFGWYLGINEVSNPALGTVGGAVLGAVVYYVFYRIRKSKQERAAEDNMVLMETLEDQFSMELSTLEEAEKLAKWDDVKVDISASKLTPRNQNILIHRLERDYNLSVSALISSRQLMEVAETATIESNRTPEPISPARYGAMVEEEITRRIRAQPGVVDVKQEVRFGSMMADLVVENKQGQRFIVEVKSARQDRKFPHAVEQIKRMVSESAYTVSEESIVSRFFEFENGMKCRLFVAELSQQEEE